MCTGSHAISSTSLLAAMTSSGAVSPCITGDIAGDMNGEKVLTEGDRDGVRTRLSSLRHTTAAVKLSRPPSPYASEHSRFGSLDYLCG